MTRRKMQFFNLSFLDLMTGALGAIIFLFIITPKGGESAAPVRQAAIYVDTVQMKLYGDLPDSLLKKEAGDTLFAVLLGHKLLPKEKEKFPRILPVPRQKEVPKKEEPVKKEQKEPKKETKPREEPRPEAPKPDPKPPVYRGDAPSVPCKVSIEISWASKQNNVDLFVCRGNSCVYGGDKRDRMIGEWDSGKSRNRLFGNDLRTNQEAVRQFDEIIPGEYEVYAEFKDSADEEEAIVISGLIYTKNEQGEERGESFSKRLSLGGERVLIGRLVIEENGSYVFSKE
jgi:hypothetical protein